VETGSKLFVVWMAVFNAHFLYLYASFGSFYAVQGLHCARNLRLLVLFYQFSVLMAWCTGFPLSNTHANVLTYFFLSQATVHFILSENDHIRPHTHGT
jgi:hypothetical protein